MGIPQPSFEQMKGYHFPAPFIKRFIKGSKLYSDKAMIDLFNSTVNYYESKFQTQIDTLVNNHKLELDSIKREKNKIIQDNNDTNFRVIATKDALISKMRTEIGSLNDRLEYIAEDILDNSEVADPAPMVNNKPALTCNQVKRIRELITEKGISATIVADLLQLSNSTISKIVNNKTYKNC